MKEKLIIKNFGPIKDVELELGKFNILIGEQATGKSTVAKVLAVCRYFSYINTPWNHWDEPFLEGLNEWGLAELVEDNKTYISYESDHYSFTAESYKGISKEWDYINGEEDLIGEHLGFVTNLNSLSNTFTKLLNELENIKPQRPEGYGFYDYEWKIPTSFYQNEVASVLDNPFYFPVDRGLQSIFSLGKSSVQNLNDTLFNQFAKLDHAARSFKNDTAVEPLNITYKNVDGQGFIKSEKHDFVRLANAASGYQSTIPVVLTIKYYNNRNRKKGKTFIIEEPELNLFPEAQKNLIEYLVEQVNVYNNSFLITTHSPYVLTPLNNLLYAYQVGQTYELETQKIIEKKLWLNPAEVSAYRMLPDGTCENIIDKEEHLIKADKIDEVTNKVNEDFEKLLNTQLVHS